MTYIADQTSDELRRHIRRLQRTPGWSDPVTDRLFKEIVAQDETIKVLRAERSAQGQSSADINELAFAPQPSPAAPVTDGSIREGDVLSYTMDDGVGKVTAHVRPHSGSSAGISVADWERVFQDACDEAGCAYDNEALLKAIADLKVRAEPQAVSMSRDAAQSLVFDLLDAARAFDSAETGFRKDAREYYEEVRDKVIAALSPLSCPAPQEVKVPPVRVPDANEVNGVSAITGARLDAEF